MPGPVERWLDSFMCSQFANVFELHGFRTIESVCYLQGIHLQSMQIPPKFWDVILRNVHGLKLSYGESNQYILSKTQLTNPEESFHQRYEMMHPNMDRQHNMMDSVPCSTGFTGSFNYRTTSTETSPFHKSSNIQHDVITSDFSKYPYQHGMQETNTSQVGKATTMPTSQNYNLHGNVAGSNSLSHPAMRQSHPHLRNAGQNPQDVANNILQMANSSYPTNNTVQVPLSQNRTSPYHRQSQFGIQHLNSFLQHEGEFNQSQFPMQGMASHIQHQRQEYGASPVSPASANMIASPHSQHSGSFSHAGSSPCQMNSPGGASVRSSASDYVADQWCSPIHQPMMDSPMSQQHMAQQHQPNYSMSSPSLQVSAQSPQHHSPHGRMAYYHQFQYSSPTSSQCSQLSPGVTRNSPSCQNNSPGISTMYAAINRQSYSSPSPQKPFSGTLSHQSTGQVVHSAAHRVALSSSNPDDPLVSLQRLCQMSSTEVLAPQTIITHTSASPNCSKFVRSHSKKGMKTDFYESDPGKDVLECVKPCDPLLNKSISDSKDFAKTTSKTETADNELNISRKRVSDTTDTCCQPKKMMLKRAAFDNPEVPEKADMSQEVDNSLSSVNLLANHESTIRESTHSILQDLNTDNSIEHVNDSQYSVNRLEICVRDQTFSMNSSDTSGSHITEKSKHGNETVDDYKDNLSSSKKDSVNEESTVSGNSTSDGSSGNIVTSICLEHCKKEKSNIDLVQSNIAKMCKNVPVNIMELKNTIGKIQSLQQTEKSSRMRVGSAGSPSDTSGTSDYDGDDLHNGEQRFSDLDDTCMVDGLASSNSCDSEDVVDAVVISKWTDKTNCSVATRRKVDTDSLSGLHFSNRNHSRGLSRVSLDFCQGDSDVDSLAYPSPEGCDTVDGPIGVDNENGTMSVVSCGRVRSRKTPVKYKDTSFFQGDFVFVEEEEEYLPKNQTKKRLIKTSIPMDVNHNTKKNGHFAKKDNKCENNVKSPEKKADASNKSKQTRSPSKQKAEKNLRDTLNRLTKETVKQYCKVKKIKIPKKEKDDRSESESEKEEEKCSQQARNKTPVLTQSSFSKARGSPVKNEVVTRKASRTSKSPSLDDANKTNIVNGVANEKTATPAKVTIAVPSKVSETPLRKNSISKVTPKEDEKIIIEITSDSSDENTESKTGKDTNNSDDRLKAKCEPDIICVESEINSESNDFKFSLVEDDIIYNLDDQKLDVDEIGKIEDTSETKNCVLKSEFPKHVTSKQSKKKSKSVKANKRKAFEEDDPDFEMGPKKKAFKSITANEKEIKKKKDTRDKWANFKGPKVVFEGEKETPDRCFVVNDPFDEIEAKGSNRSKLITQNVTRIEISNLPSDKSVLAPSSDNLQSEQWVCALCGKHSSYKFLGDLFGPYTVETMSTDLLDLSPQMNSSKKRRVEDQPGTGKKRGQRSCSVSMDTSEWKEVWVHESCSIYSDGVFLIGNKIYGLQEAVRIASQTPCSVCGENGAMIGCLNKGCQQKYHHVCAQETDCFLDEENFSLLCPKHKVKKLKQLEAMSTSLD
ncbi:uncharacterized protein LOC127866607 [Dreissena polymorpha]|uniref:PHD-type domain-containing protein n=1 Tax=Dreissena polymorpha TaxID=45954 RepID=A0A9D4RET0_DREPO|nr:uncharacterized protein LOC127866607 [Dreissena polymorpha]KAH3863655.1 hypothetical protein DPMN_026644 [Dreissena polymorpha]